MSLMEGIVGNGRMGLADGVGNEVRLSRTGAVVIQQAHGQYFEGAFRGRIFNACTAVAGVAPGTALGTTSAFYLHNPIGSNVVLAIIRSSIGYVSGTLGAGVMCYTTHAGLQAVNPSGTTIVTRSGLIGGNAASVGLALTTATVVTQLAIRPVFNIGAALASTALGVQPCMDLVDGDIIIPEGFGMGIHGIAAAGTSPLVVIGCTWEEIPVKP